MENSIFASNSPNLEQTFRILNICMLAKRFIKKYKHKINSFFKKMKSKEHLSKSTYRTKKNTSTVSFYFCKIAKINFVFRTDYYPNI